MDIWHTLLMQTVNVVISVIMTYYDFKKQNNKKYL